MSKPGSTQLKTSASEFLDSLFQELENYDPKVVQLIKEHLGQRALHPKAGFRLAKDLVQLAKARAMEGNQ